jgi:hypothetical protein
MVFFDYGTLKVTVVLPPLHCPDDAAVAPGEPALQT